MSTLTIEQRREKLEYIAAIPESVLRGSTLRQLRDLVSGGVLRDSNGEAFSYGRVKKEELLEKILEVRAEHLKEKSTTILVESLENRIEGIYKQLRDIGLQCPEDWRDRVNALIVSHLYVEGSNYEISTQANNQSKAKKILREKLSTESALVQREVEPMVTLFENLYKQGLSTVQSEKKRRQTENVAQRAVSRSEVSIVELYKELKAAIENPNEKEWVKVSLALTLFTGRRPNEIHGQGNIEPLTVGTAIFSGQAKTKLRDCPDYEIPTLIDSNVCANALKFLESIGRRYPGTDDKFINSKIATPQKRQMEKLSVLCKKADGTPYKAYDLRRIYAAICSQRFGHLRSELNPAKYIAMILGHDEKDLGSANSYQDYYISDSDIEAIKSL